jgi:DNA-binding NtrC family response regulator
MSAESAKPSAAWSVVDDGISGGRMKPCSLVVLEKDARIARGLVSSLHRHIQSIRVTNSCTALHDEIAKRRAQMAVVDIEQACLEEISKLHQEYPHLMIVCTHRLADDAMWVEALRAGASDLCGAFDLRSIVSSVLGLMRHSQAAAA